MSRKHTQTNKQVGFARETANILRTVQVDNRIQRRRATLVGTITSDGIGRIKDVIPLNPSTSSDWGSLAALYDEFRVVGCRLQIVSRTQNTVTLASNAVFIMFDNDSNAVLTSYAEASEYQNSHMIPALFNNAHTYMFNFARPSAGKETTVAWCDVATPTQCLGAVKLYGDTLALSTNYFTYQMEWAIEFRGFR